MFSTNCRCSSPMNATKVTSFPRSLCTQERILRCRLRPIFHRGTGAYSLQTCPQVTQYCIVVLSNFRMPSQYRTGLSPTTRNSLSCKTVERSYNVAIKTKCRNHYLPRDAMLARSTLSSFVCRSFLRSQAGIVWKRLDGSSWFLAWMLPSTYPTLC